MRRIAQLSGEAVGEMRSLKHQVSSLQGEVRNFVTKDDARSLSETAALPAVQEIRALQRQVQAIEESLQRHFASVAPSPQQDTNVQLALSDLEERLERRLALLQQSDAEIIQQCNSIRQGIEILPGSSTNLATSSDDVRQMSTWA